MNLDFQIEKCHDLCRGCGFFVHGEKGCDKGLVSKMAPKFTEADLSGSGDRSGVLKLIPATGVAQLESKKGAAATSSSLVPTAVTTMSCPKGFLKKA